VQLRACHYDENSDTLTVADVDGTTYRYDCVELENAIDMHPAARSNLLWFKRNEPNACSSTQFETVRKSIQQRVSETAKRVGGTACRSLSGQSIRACHCQRNHDARRLTLSNQGKRIWRQKRSGQLVVRTVDS